MSKPNPDQNFHMEKVECVVVGAGVIGLAVARRLAQDGREVIVLEAAEGIGTITSSRNSEVIHAGIYYRAGSLMARMCVGGKQALYSYCREQGVPHRNCGKLIVATTPAETEKLASIRAHAEANGVTDLQTLSGEAARAMEPALHARRRCCRPPPASSTVTLTCSRCAAMPKLPAPPLRFIRRCSARRARDGGRSRSTPAARHRCRFHAGFWSTPRASDAATVARNIEGMPVALIPPAYLAKGNYFSCAARAPFSHLIYPVPEPGGLGVHLTLDMAGQARFGPDVEWVDSIDYAVDPARAERFYPAIRRYWPALPDGALMPSYSGMRPKIVPPAVAVQDFLIQGPKDHGVGGLINLFGIESPGLTSSLAIADYVGDLMDA